MAAASSDSDNFQCCYTLEYHSMIYLFRPSSVTEVCVRFECYFVDFAILCNSRLDNGHGHPSIHGKKGEKSIIEHSVHIRKCHEKCHHNSYLNKCELKRFDDSMSDFLVNSSNICYVLHIQHAIYIFLLFHFGRIAILVIIAASDFDAY